MTRNRFKVATTVQIVLVLVPAALRLTLAYPLEEFLLRYEQQDRALGTTDGNPGSSYGVELFDTCPQEAERCYDDEVCVSCVTTSITGDECGDRYPVLESTNKTECEDLEALVCCGFDLVGNDVCRTDELTLSFWTCGLGSKGCNNTLPCSVGSSYSQSPTTAPSRFPTGVGSAINGAMGASHPGSNGIVVYAGAIAFWIVVQGCFHTHNMMCHALFVVLPTVSHG